VETLDGWLEWYDVGDGELVPCEVGGVCSRRLSTGHDIVGRTCALRLKKDIVEKSRVFFPCGLRQTHRRRSVQGSIQTEFRDSGEIKGRSR
jgi:hypothetical protein